MNYHKPQTIIVFGPKKNQSYESVGKQDHFVSKNWVSTTRSCFVSGSSE